MIDCWRYTSWALPRGQPGQGQCDKLQAQWTTFGWHHHRTIHSAWSTQRAQRRRNCLHDKVRVQVPAHVLVLVQGQGVV